MNIKRIVNLGTLIILICTFAVFTIIYFQNDINATLVQLGLFLMFCATLFVGNFALFEFNTSTSIKLKTNLTYLNFGLSLVAGLVFFDLIPFEQFWTILVGIGILYLLSIQLQLLGWSGKKHNLIYKVIFLLVLISNLFLAALFLFQLDFHQLRPAVYGAVGVSIFAIFYGLYFNGFDSTDPEKQKV